MVFDGYTKAKDENGDAIGVVLIEVKKGKGKLSREETLIKRAVDGGKGFVADDFLKDKETGSGRH